MKTLVTGGYGLLGTEVIRECLERGWASEGIDLDTLDIRDLGAFVEKASTSSPDAIIHCAAWTEVDACESDPDKAHSVNAVGARNAAIAAREAGAKLVYVSTDYVFDGGGERPYREFDPVGPVSEYGRSKEAGERLVREQTPEHFIVRTAWLYGEKGKGFPDAIVAAAKKCADSGNALRVVNDQHGTPTWSRELARQIATLVETNYFGTYHTTAAGKTTWYDFAKAIVDTAGIDVRVDPCTSEEFVRPAPRPANSVLDNMMLRLQGLDVMKPWEEAWRDYTASTGNWADK